MSIAGTRSSRGDAYQVAIAMKWAIRALTEPDIAWIEIDSTRQIAGGIPIPVDDIVVGRSDGSMSCSQCKKNQPKFTAWGVKELEDELLKAARLLANEPSARVIFSARADFGDLARLKDYATQASDMASFDGALAKDLLPAITALRACWSPVLSGGNHTPYDLLQRIEFELTPSVDDLPDILKAQLGQIATRADDAYNALWARLDTLGAHLVDHTQASSHRITRDEVIELMWKAGSAIAPPRSHAETLEKFSSMSSIGKQGRRDAGGEELIRPAVQELADAIDAGEKMLLLTDGPGAGKTVVLLQLLERLEARQDVATLFLQAREFADAGTHAERVARGLEPDVAALVSAMSQSRRTVVVVDSLDVLSLARDNEGLSFFLALVDRLAQIPSVSVVVACRTFDLQYNRRLASRKWNRSIEVKPLDWGTAVQPLLTRIGLPVNGVDEATRILLGNPRNLALYIDVVRKTGRRSITNAQELTEAYLQAVVRDEHSLGDAAMVAVEALAAEMLAKRSLQVPRSRITIPDAMLEQLLSLNVLLRAHDGTIGFGHQTLLDALAVQAAVRRGQNLHEFIKSLQPVPFVRPAIRAFLIHLRLRDKREFRSQVRTAFDTPGIAFHIKRLIAESLGELIPQPDDWSLIRHIYNAHHLHFHSLYAAASRPEWHPFWMQHFVPLLKAQDKTSWIQAHARRVETWLNVDPAGVFDFWISSARSAWGRSINLRGLVGLALQKFTRWSEVDAQSLFEALLALPLAGHDFLGDVLLNWSATSDANVDDLLWRYVTSDVPVNVKDERELENALRCDGNWLQHPEALAARLFSSDRLLGHAIVAIERWSNDIGESRNSEVGETIEPNRRFLESTSFGKTHSRYPLRHISALDRLVGAIESAVLRHADADDGWWRENRHRLYLNCNGALRHMGMIAVTRHPDQNAEIAPEFFTDVRRVELGDVFELGNLISETAYVIGDAIELVQEQIFATWSSLPEAGQWVEVKKFQLLLRVPASLRSTDTIQFIERLAPLQQLPSREPDIYRSGGAVAPPFSVETLVGLSDESLAQLLISSGDMPSHAAWGARLFGGIHAMQGVIHGAAAMAPGRMLLILKRHWVDIAEQFRGSVVEGAAASLRYQHGNLTPPSPDWKPQQKLAPDVVALLLLDELEAHSTFWQTAGERAGAAMLVACAQVSKTPAIIDRVLALSVGFIHAASPHEEQRDGDLIHIAINSTRGEIAQALIALANSTAEAERDFPALLLSTLEQLARDSHPAVRAIVLRELAFLQYKRPDEGWELFALAVDSDDERIWIHAESCLFYAHDEQFNRIERYLERMEGVGLPEVRTLWGKISALACLTGHIELSRFIDKLNCLQDHAAWGGAGMVWSTNARQPEFSNHCFEALDIGLGASAGRRAILENINVLFEKEPPIALVPMPLFRSVFVEPAPDDMDIQLFSWMVDWICELAELDPDGALAAAEVVAACQARGQSHFYDAQSLGTLLTTLFREAEERELSDRGEMLARTVALHDAFLAMPTGSLDEWLRDAERPSQ